jgi:peptidoglycan/xylan/chitin deacetylase (PgdA/CDA1 family)
VTLRRVAAALFVVALVFGAFHLVRRLSEQPVPAVVTRATDAHRLLARGPAAWVDRALNDRAPGDRDRRPRLIALTFDDGPYPVETPLLLDELAELHVPATFFLVGRDTEEFPALAQRIARAGNEIANHTETHPARFDQLSPAGVTAELSDGAATLEKYVRDPAIRTMMRPPHGRFTESTVETAQRDGYHVILWNDDPGDWRSIPPAAIVEHMEANATAPDIVLLHSGRLSTVEAMPAIVARFRAAGYTFVTVGQLMTRVPAAEIVHPEKLRV